MKMENDKIVKLLECHGVKPTVNRIVIAKTLAVQERPVSMKDLEYKILSIDKSNIFRTLMLFREHHVVHIIEDGEGGIKYELCHSHDAEYDDDEHVHFYCESCHKTFCLYDISMPKVNIPEGYEVTSANYILRGVCPECRKKKK